MVCPQCRQPFEQKPWPAQTMKYCTVACMKRAWYLRNKEEVHRRIRERCRANRPQRLEVQRRWNAKPRSKELKQAWQRAHYKEWYARIKDTGAAAVINARTRSRQHLKKYQPDKACVCPPPHRGRIECHHKDFNPFNTDVTNLEWRCHYHHQEAHGRLRPPLSSAEGQGSLPHPEPKLD